MEESVDQTWLNIKNTIQSTAEECLGVLTTHRKNRWFNQKCEEAVIRKNNARHLWLNDINNIQKEEHYRSECKEATKIVRQQKREYMSNIIKDMETNHQKNESRKFFKVLKSMKRGHQQNTYGLKDKNGNMINTNEEMCNTWKEYFVELLNCEAPSNTFPQEEVLTCEPQINDLHLKKSYI